ncbi:hypothetical protein BD413DRAFT_148643 [Trametes elegans]|nr:hypothetical protein BD413DRAFT_148643 [Trametes elegans]
MNVSALVNHDDPNDDPRRRQPRHEQDIGPPPPPLQVHAAHRPPHHSSPLDRPRDRERERDRPPLDIPHHAQQPISLVYRRSPPPQYSSRPPSPPRHLPYPPPGSDYPAQQQRLHHLPPPPPSPLYSSEPYELSYRQSRGNPDVQPLPPHDRLGPPGERHSPLVSVWCSSPSRLWLPCAVARSSSGMATCARAHALAHKKGSLTLQFTASARTKTFDLSHARTSTRWYRARKRA